MDYLREIEFIKPILREASERFIIPRFHNLAQKEIVKKGRYDEIVTKADIEASDFILSNCRKRFPGSFTEEHLDSERFRYNTLWSIDPLDGTDEFKQGKEGFCVQAALLQKTSGENTYLPVTGIIYLPLLKKFVYATKDAGPFFSNGKKSRKIRVDKLNMITGTQREIDPSLELDEFYKLLSRKGVGVKILHTGGAGSTIAEMIIGKAHRKPNLYIMPRPYTKEWDLSPAENIIRRSGGWISDLYGNPFFYNRENPKNENGYIVAIGLDKDNILSLLNQFGIKHLLKNPVRV